MNTQQKLLNNALNGLDTLGFHLDNMGITSKVNRHNLAALIVLEQKYLEGQWDSLQVRLDRKKLQLEKTLNCVDNLPLVGRITRLRTSSRA